jgi:hypothetical protein
MTAWPEARATGFLAAVATRAERWLLEPAVPSRPDAADPDPDTRAVIAVIGLAARCGTTTVARALGVELARRDRGGAAIVSSSAAASPVRSAGVPAVATAGARRLARALPSGAATAAGRICLVDADDPALRELAGSRPAPLVLDVAHGRPPEGPIALADATVLVASPAVEPALADVVAASLARGDEPPLVVLNRAVEPERWDARDALLVAESRLGARLALAGRDPTPGLARPIAELADRLTGEWTP